MRESSEGSSFSHVKTYLHTRNAGKQRTSAIIPFVNEIYLPLQRVTTCVWRPIDVPVDWSKHFIRNDNTPCRKVPSITKLSLLTANVAMLAPTECPINISLRPPSILVDRASTILIISLTSSLMSRLLQSPDDPAEHTHSQNL